MRETRHYGSERAGGHIDHAAPFTRAHARHESCRDQKGTIEIDRKNLAPVGKTHFGEILLRKYAGTIDHDIDVIELRTNVLRHRGDRFFRRYVALDRDSLAAGSLDHLHGVLAVCKIGDRYVDAILRQALCKSLADAASTAGDDRNFILVALGHVTPRKSAQRTKLNRPHGEERSEGARLEPWAASPFKTPATRAPQDEGGLSHMNCPLCHSHGRFLDCLRQRGVGVTCAGDIFG